VVSGAAAAGAVAAAEAAEEAGVVCWWEQEEEEEEEGGSSTAARMMREAMDEVAAEPWRTPWFAAAPPSADATAAAAAPLSHAHAAARFGHLRGHAHGHHGRAHAGPGGRWEVVVGLVGKPSAGKSTLFNALTDPSSAAEEAKEGAFPFTTIRPNTGRGFALVPDPALALGLSADACRPAYGYARGFDLAALERAGAATDDGPVHGLGPLRTVLEATGAAGAAGEQQQHEASASASAVCWPAFWRRVPVVVRDVAGLVPGAYLGRGRGNAFLADLCDADVLVHVVDCSGTTTADGALAVATTGEEEERPTEEGKGAAAAATPASSSTARPSGITPSDPRDDVRWVAEEIHRWVFNNVKAKWSAVRRRPGRLPELFSGYQSSRAMVDEALSRAGVPPSLLALSAAASSGASAAAEAAAAASALAQWGPRDLHRLVACFVAVRFPTLLALNKADAPGAAARIAAVRRAYPRDAAVAVSARAERWLLAKRRAGEVEYGADNGPVRLLLGGGGLAAAAAPEAAAAAHAAAATDQTTHSHLRRLEQGVFAQLGGGSGVAAVLAAAVALRPPAVFFPVGDRQTCAAIAVGGRAAGGGGGGSEAKMRAAEGREAGVLRDAVLMRPGSTVHDAFEALKRPPLGLLAGDFVRAEAAVAGGGGGGGGGGSGANSLSWRVVRKEERLSPGCCVLHVQTTRRSAWQAAAQAQARQQVAAEGASSSAAGGQEGEGAEEEAS